jgi:hypothetical protein
VPSPRLPPAEPVRSRHCFLMTAGTPGAGSSSSQDWPLPSGQNLRRTALAPCTPSQYQQATLRLSAAQQPSSPGAAQASRPRRRPRRCDGGPRSRGPPRIRRCTGHRSRMTRRTVDESLRRVKPATFVAAILDFYTVDEETARPASGRQFSCWRGLTAPSEVSCALSRPLE